MPYAAELDAVLRYSSHEAFQRAILKKTDQLFASGKTPRGRFKGTDRDLSDANDTLVYADFLADEGHPAEHVLRWWTDPERAAEGERVGMSGMFVGPANAPKGPDGISWSIGHSRKIRLHPKYPLWVHVAFEQPNAESTWKYGRYYAPVTPDEATTLADHIDRFYDGKHPIAYELREAADRYRKRR